MKTIAHFSLGVVVCCSSAVFAQPTITNPNTTPVFGKQYNVSVSSNAIAVGSAGANQTWDLTALTTDSVVTWTTAAPQGTDSIGEANVVLESGQSSFYSMKVTQSAEQVYGLYLTISEGDVLLTYSDPEDMVRFPMTYNRTYTDNWECSYTFEGYNVFRTGTTSDTVDGYGTLYLPNDTIANVLRVHHVQNFTDSMIYSRFSFTNIGQNDEYLWFVQGIDYPLATIASMTNSVISSVVTQGNYLKNNKVAIDTNASIATVTNTPIVENNAMPVAPDIVKGIAKVNLNFEHSGIYKLQLCNSMGVMVIQMTGETGQGKNNFDLNVADLPQGVYYFSVGLIGEAAITQPIVVAN